MPVEPRVEGPIALRERIGDESDRWPGAYGERQQGGRDQNDERANEPGDEAHCLELL